MSSLTLHVENFSRPLLPQKQGKGNTSKADVPELFVTDTLCSVHCRRDLADAISTGVSAQLNSDGSRNATASARAPKPDSIELCNHRSTHSPPEPTLEEILNMYERGFTGDESKGYVWWSTSLWARCWLFPVIILCPNQERIIGRDVFQVATWALRSLWRWTQRAKMRLQHRNGKALRCRGCE